MMSFPVPSGDIIFPCAQFPICLISDCDDVISSTNRDRLYYLDTELRLLRNLTWETDGALLSMCSDTTVSAMRVYPYLGNTLYTVVSVQREVGFIYVFCNVHLRASDMMPFVMGKCWCILCAYN